MLYFTDTFFERTVVVHNKALKTFRARCMYLRECIVIHINLYKKKVRVNENPYIYILIHEEKLKKKKRIIRTNFSNYLKYSGIINRMNDEKKPRRTFNLHYVNVPWSQ